MYFAFEVDMFQTPYLYWFVLVLIVLSAANLFANNRKNK